MNKQTHDEIQQVFIDAVLKAQKQIEDKYNVKTRIDINWEAVQSEDEKKNKELYITKNIISDDVYMAM